jgi:pimeloyl-ACP methyl ester carboxylesterase
VPFVVANGVRHHVQRLGGGAGVPVVMLHGLLFGSVASWFFTAAPALARGRSVMLYDLRGHGLSDRPETGYDVVTMVGDLAALCAEHAGPFDLVGHSWGALVALRYALAMPERVRRLVLVDAPLPPSTLGSLDVLALRDPDALLASLPSAVRARAVRGRRQLRRWRDATRALLTGTSLVDDVAAEGDLSDAELAQLGCPTLLVCGQVSACRPVGQRLARVLPRAELSVVPGGHYLPIESGDTLTAELVGFLSARERAPRAEVLA